MNTNDILKTLHDALVAKAQERVAVEGKAKVAASLKNILAYFGN